MHNGNALVSSVGFLWAQKILLCQVLVTLKFPKKIFITRIYVYNLVDSVHNRAAHLFNAEKK